MSLKPLAFKNFLIDSLKSSRDISLMRLSHRTGPQKNYCVKNVVKFTNNLQKHKVLRPLTLSAITAII